VAERLGISPVQRQIRTDEIDQALALSERPRVASN
jgi:hypothetical protein